jgi:probable rRNA maturation factor
VAIVGESTMKNLAKKYLGEDIVHNVLSFPYDETKGKFVAPPDNVIHLGEIAVCYPKVTEEANIEGKLTDDKIYELIEHGALHLLGKHHE